jgi:hypothetical protein
MGAILSLLLLQVQVSVSPIPQAAAGRLLSKRVAKAAMPWTVSLENQSDGPVSVSEPAILRRIPQLAPIDHQSMSLLIAEASINSPWARAGRVGEDVTRLAAFLAASKNIRIGDPALTGITAFLALSPYLVQRLRGADRPVQQNFEALAWTQPVTLQPGESATERVFTATWGQPQSVSFTIDTSRLKAAKVIQ